jgi:hypothetical protein
MSNRVKAYGLAVLLVLLGWVLLRQFQNSPQVIAGQPGAKFVPIDVDDPTLRIDDIAASQKREYQGKGRNIFNYGRAPVVQQPVEQKPVEPVEVKTEPPPPPPPPFKFYGVATNSASGRKRAFFTNGEDIWIAEEGQMIDRRFKLVSIGATSAEVEETATGRRVTMPLEELPGSGG